MNVLFLSIEDLNDFIEPLGGHPQVVTPNIAKLAARSAVFERAYATAPACSPSRAAVLFGQAPWRTGLYTNFHDWRMVHPQGERLSLVGHMRDAGFATIGAGKIFHLADRGIDPDDWDEHHAEPRDSFPPTSLARRAGRAGPNGDFGPQQDEAPLYDDRNVARIEAEMRRGADRRFWAIGLFRPHLPCIVPRRFFDLYPERPTPAPGLAGAFDAEDESQLAGLPAEAKRLVRRSYARRIAAFDEYHAFLRAYLASVSYADALVGRLLARLEAEGLVSNTLIVLWSDHGNQFGEKLCFLKFTLWERALRVPILVAGPGIAPRRVEEPVTNVDLFPTLLARAGARPKQATDGRDLSPLLSGANWREPDRAQSVWAVLRDEGRAPLMASTVRTRTHRYIRYWNGGEELYHNAADPFERRNLLAGLAPARWTGRFRLRALRRALAAQLPAPLAPARPPLPLAERVALRDDDD